MASSHISAAEYLSGDSEESLEDDFYGQVGETNDKK
jgi:hypothetical protein